MRRVNRFDATTIRFHAEGVGRSFWTYLVVGAQRVGGTPVLPDQTGQVHGLRQ
jgi:hypothetical protein